MALWLCSVLAKEVLTIAHLQEGQKDTHPELVIPSDRAEVLALLCFKFAVCASLQSSFGEQQSRQVRNCRQTQERVRPLTPSPTPGGHPGMNTLTLEAQQCPGPPVPWLLPVPVGRVLGTPHRHV